MALQAIDVDAIERQLTELWKDAGATHDNDGEAGVIRACVLNLLVYVPSGPAEHEVDNLLVEVTAVHPGRAFLISSDPAMDSSAISAWVTTRCTMATPGSKQVCCEQITVKAHGTQVSELPSAIEPLILADLPVFLWWRAQPPLGERVFTRLTGMSDRLIIDSASFDDPHHGLKELAAVFASSNGGHRWVATSDLNWGRLTSWQGLIAGFYDVANYRSHLSNVSSVRIEFKAARSGDFMPPRALLLAAWLSARLNWTLDSASTESGSGQWEFTFTDQGKSRRIKLASTHGGGGDPGQLCAITFHLPETEEACFAARKTADGGHLETLVSLSGERKIGQLLSHESLPESQLIGQELEILGHDEVYEEAVARAAEMLAALNE
jgi:glucose-6-phosphate dehydrogenase assembly protein OpcA